MTKLKPNRVQLLGAFVLIFAAPPLVYWIFNLVESLGIVILQDRPWAILLLATVIPAVVVAHVVRLLLVKRPPATVTIVHSDVQPMESALHRATPEEVVALFELGEWMKKHQRVLATGRYSGIRIGATHDVIQFMAKHLDSDSAGTVVGNLVPLPN